VLFRVLGVFIAAPMLTSAAIPARARVLIALMLAAAVYPSIMSRLEAPPILDVFDLIPYVLAEALIGMCIGLLASLPLMALEAAGVVAGHQMGLSLARIYNPELDTDADLTGQLLFFAAFASFIMIGGIEALFSATLQTFDRVPLGGMDPAAVPLESLVGLVTSGLELAVRVAAPVIGVVLLLSIALGALSKTMPQINIMSVGFAAKAVAGLVMIAFGTSSGVAAVMDEIDDAGRHIARFISSIETPHTPAPANTPATDPAFLPAPPAQIGGW
jgi:flagellar biosynthetic protein FliR